MELPAPGPASPPLGLHILVVDPDFQDGRRPGADRTRPWAARFAAAGHRVTVIATTLGIEPEPPTGGRIQRFTTTDAEIRARRVPRGAAWGLPPVEAGRFGRWAAGELWQVRAVDAVLMTAKPWWLIAPAWLFTVTRGIPLFVDVPAAPPARPDTAAPFSTRFSAGLRRYARRVALALADRVVTASPGIAAALAADGVPDSHRLEVPNGCDPPRLRVMPGQDNPFLHDHPDLVGRTLLVHAGWLASDRPLVRLVDLAAALQEIGIDATVVICGDGPARPLLIQRAHDRGLSDLALRITGPVPRAQMPSVIAAATAVLAVPSRDDTTGAFFDGLAGARPVIFLGEGWQRTLLESRGAGFGVPVDDPMAAAREIADVLRDPDGLRRAGQQAEALAATRFHVDRLAAEVRQLIEGVVAQDPRQAVMRRRTLITKRALDIVVAASALVVLSPLLLGLAAVIALKLGPPVVTQPRIGWRGRVFTLFKYRTLPSQEPVPASVTEQEVSGFGRLLRRLALDELPELVNVLIGDMSLVGPRPHPAAYAPYYSPAQRRRHDVRPGLTGWAQVHPAESWDEKFARDLEYVDRLSLTLDARIIWRTLGVLLRGRRDLQPERAPMPRFDEMMARREGAEDA